MIKKENVSNIEQTIDDPKPPIEEEIETKVTSGSKNPSQINFNFTDDAAHEDEMEPVRDILSAGMEESEEIGMDLVLLSVEDVAAFLKCSYDVQGWVTFPELWKRDDSFFYEIATGIFPQVNSWASRFPAVAHAVKTVSAAGSWGRLIWDIAGTWVIVVRRRQLEAQKKREEEEGKAQNAGLKIDYTNQQQQQQPTNNRNQFGSKQGIIIP